jgi:hypothetical protein
MYGITPQKAVLYTAFSLSPLLQRPRRLRAAQCRLVLIELGRQGRVALDTRVGASAAQGIIIW